MKVTYISKKECNENQKSAKRKEDVMRAITMILLAVSIAIFAGCSSKEDDVYTVKEFMYKYAEKDAITAYENMNIKFKDTSFNDVEVELIRPIKFNKNIEVAKNNGVTTYDIKCRIDYIFRLKSDKSSTRYCIRYAAVKVEKKGFADPMVLTDFSKEIFVAARVKELAEKLEKVAEGEKLIR
ncbi:MAG: hypothetical protein US25_C0008G0004 [Candidatus Moranbacteria bacterium GW2011_GWE1_36_7]|nr:MAG: hypothetical protein US25_C0008G0004 [Candidatus Moranbacteria bacterium GW2011_GWE1_36_7]